MSKPSLHKLFDKLPLSIIRFLFNSWPPFLGAGIKVTRISPDFRSFDVAMKLKLLNRNYVGVHFGGSLFSMTDPFYMLILSKNLGNQYIVWDKAASIEFKKPGRGTIKATCFEEELSSIKNEVDRLGKLVIDKTIQLVNNQNEVVAIITKTLYIRKKDFENK